MAGAFLILPAQILAIPPDSPLYYEAPLSIRFRLNIKEAYYGKRKEAPVGILAG